MSTGLPRIESQLLSTLKSFEHTGVTLYDHLVGTWKLLKEWGCSKDLCNAGLFHSVYGTHSYKHEAVCTREVVRNIIGERSEHLVYVFCTTPTPRTNYFVTMSEPDRADLMTLAYANELEQKSPTLDRSLYLPYIHKIKMEITAYTTADCFYCYQLKELFKRAEIEYTVIEVIDNHSDPSERPGTIRRGAFARDFPDVLGFPHVIIDGKSVGGLVNTAKILVSKGLVSAKKG